MVFFFTAIVSIDISTINHSEIGVICTNLANELGQHLACMKKRTSIVSNNIDCESGYFLFPGISDWIISNNISACESNHIQSYPIISGVPSDHLHEDNHGPEAQPRVVAVSASPRAKAKKKPALEGWCPQEKCGENGIYSSKWPWKIGKMMINHD